MPANIQEQLKCLNDDRRTTDKMLLDCLFNDFFNNKNWSTTAKKNLGPTDTKLVDQRKLNKNRKLKKVDIENKD